MAVDQRVLNIIQLGLAFMLIFTAFQSCGMIQSTVVESFLKIHNATGNGSDFGGLRSDSGYISLATIYASFTICNFLAPPIIGKLGPRLSMVLGASTYLLFLAQFLLPILQGWLLYTCSVILGLGAAVIWPAQGNYLTLNSDETTIGRNSGVVWALLQCSFLFGSLFLYFEFQGQDVISDGTRRTVYISFTGLCGAGILVLALLRKTPPKNVDDETHIIVDENDSAVVDSAVAEKGPVIKRIPTCLEDFFKTFKFLAKRELLLLAITFAYTGLELSFFSGVYGTSLANTQYFGTDSNALIGISGMFIGVGEILGGAIFGIFGSRTIRYSRNPIILLGLITHFVAYFLVFLNIPAYAPLKYTDDKAYLHPNKYVAVICSFCLGFADSCWNTQLYSILGSMFPEDSAPAFALFKFFQSLTAAIAFFYSTTLLLQWQLLILVVTAFCAGLAFFHVEWGVVRMKLENAAAN